MTFIKITKHESDKCFVEDFISGKKFNIQNQALRESLLLDKCKILDDVIQQIPSTDYSLYLHWIKRGWFGSLIYYLASLNTIFVDRVNCSNNIRKSTISEYLKTEKCPEKYIPKIECNVFAREDKKLNADSNLHIKMLLQRYSARHFSNAAVNADEILSITKYAFEDIRGSIKNARLCNNELKFLQSTAVAFDIYFVTYNVNLPSQGVYHLNIEKNSLGLVKSGNYALEVSQILQGMKASLTAAGTMFLIAQLKQSSWRYRHERALRNIYIESGVICQNFIEAALYYNIQGVCTPATKDSQLLNLLNLSYTEFTPIYSFTFGKI